MFYQLYLIWAWANLKHPSIFSRWTIARTTGPISNRLNNALKINIPKIPVGPTQLDLRIVMGQIPPQKMDFWVLPQITNPTNWFNSKLFSNMERNWGKIKKNLLQLEFDPKPKNQKINLVPDPSLPLECIITIINYQYRTNNHFDYNWTIRGT